MEADYHAVSERFRVTLEKWLQLNVGVTWANLDITWAMDIKLNPTYYASTMLDAFSDLLCSKLCWHNRPGPKLNYNFIFNT